MTRRPLASFLTFPHTHPVPHRSHSRATALVPLVLAVSWLAAACSHGGDAQSAAGGDAPASASASAPAGGTSGGGGATSELHFVLTGGHDAGSYDAKSTDGGCSYGFAEPNAWGEQYSDAKAARGMSSVQMIIPGGKAATAGTRAFNITVTVGPMLSGGHNYEIDTRPDHNKGTGTVTVADHGGTATYTVDGATAEGVKIHGTVACNEVTRAG